MPASKNLIKKKCNDVSIGTCSTGSGLSFYFKNEYKRMLIIFVGHLCAMQCFLIGKKATSATTVVQKRPPLGAFNIGGRIEYF